VQNANNLPVSGDARSNGGNEEIDADDDEPPFSVDEVADE
jgi:hypothetical protein